MDKVALGKTGIKVSRLGLGTVKFGRNQGVKYPDAFEIPDEDALADLLTLAKDLGINLLDTAPAYGTSEERLGRLLKGQRKDWVIIGKAGEDFEDGVSTYNYTPDHFKYSLERSLKRLNTDYLDVLMLHSDGYDLMNLGDSIMHTLDDFKTMGVIRATGASTKTAAGGLWALMHLDVVMATYTSTYTDEKSVLNYAAKNNKGVVLKKVLGSGHARDIGKAFKFAFSHPGASAAIVGTINPKHLKDNVSSLQAALRGSA
jgi:aryl-alcohol dehydrogenase-like predicted oxidoreductase